MKYRWWKLGLVGASGVLLPKYSLVRPHILRCEEEKIEHIKDEELRRSPQISVGEENRSDQCILVVGTTGSGKSSTIAKMTGQDVMVGHQTKSVTRNCSMYVREDQQGPVWIDTVGYDDTTCLEDEESFKEVLRYISDHRLLKVLAVVWTVLPQERCDARLQKQAEFIDQFRPGKIWDNVVILAKQPGSFNLERGVQGAREAARMLGGTEGRNIQCIGFTYLDSSIPGELHDSLQQLGEVKRKEMLIATTEEVVEQVQEALDKIEEPIQVVFEDVQCEDCGVLGDRRLLPSHCHMAQLFSHPGVLRHFHSSKLETVHPLPVESRHTGVLRLGGGDNEECCTLRNTVIALTPVVGYFDNSYGIASALAAGGIHYLCSKLRRPIAYTFTCCQGEHDSPGCKLSYGCCQRGDGQPGCCYIYPCCAGGPQAPGCARKYLCCDKEEGAAGCKILCKKCGNDWGSPAGQCFRKNHELRRV